MKVPCLYRLKAICLGLFAILCAARVVEVKANVSSSVSGYTAFNPSNSEIPQVFLVKCQHQNLLQTSGLTHKSVDAAFGLYQVIATENQLEKLAMEAAKQGIRFTFQALHELHRRSWLPNDALIFNQKYLQVIQMPDAWGNGGGAVNRWGDTLVVAVLDDGLDTSHPDLKPNVWINRSEIPWNGKDDDQNGYTDDYYGWNGGDSNNVVFNSESVFYGHGTEVSGVLGAASNNQLGIAGVAYNAKLLPLHCYASKGVSSDLGVIRSLLYVYRQKKLWLTSNKQKGINVVAVNMSVGLDNTFPIETPLWCELFDSLKSVGIVSVSATTNANNNVEIVGDIPSLCPSDALIVTSSTGLDKQWVSSGYGKVSIDLAAPGDDVYTTSPLQNSPNNPYKSASGTSFAAPMVAGTAVWLNSVVCKTYLGLMQVNPDSAIGLMREWILTSVEKNASLSNKTLTGGVLQSHAAWKKMDDWCMKHEPTYNTLDLAPKQPVLFPNPSTSAGFTLLWPKEVTFEMDLIDAAGRCVLQSKGLLSNQPITLPEDLANGVYVAEILIQGNPHSVRWVLNR